MARIIFSLGLTTLVVAGSVGSTPINAVEPVSKEARKDAAAAASRADKALVRGDMIAAIAFAEAAVRLSPQSADYRMTLAQGYLRAGRFASARQAFADVNQLRPGSAKAALNLALAQIATGDIEGARATLAQNAGLIPVRDLGLAVALAGDPAGAVAMLSEAAKKPGADAKLRQNLALSLALAGQWHGARLVASADMSPADVDQRMEDWAAFAQPTAVSDQVATLLGVRAASDSGQPAVLALTAPLHVVAAPIATPVAAPTPAPEPAVLVQPEPIRPPLLLAVPAMPMVVAVTPPTAPLVAAPSVVPVVASVRWGARREVVQPLPVLSATRAVGRVAAASAPAAKGDWYIQLGAYDSPAVARAKWERLKRRYAAFSAYQPMGASVRSRDGSFYRLSVGGLTRRDAAAICGRYRTKGGSCFVRRGTGDQAAVWTRYSSKG
ncbi:Flp pilus assembly protein TadD [Sphingomonas jinjuensis]|uniref:Flp pilus assembly protein TadD n=1 Tax=Sphingomonas jinjuensis TaxID=535907 RepID=A0A840FCC4_9SPHN|nr:SPOR domain-containing protein [Sphingomonas jinjuensis]MBB4153414.1 Flp pilus assembly protein TadD [Sphingomonas jinjuensis]